MANSTEGSSGPKKDPKDEPLDLEGNTSSEVVALLADGDEIWTMDEMESAEPCDIIEIDEEDDDAEEQAAEVAESGGMIVAGGEPEEEEQAGEDVQATSGGYNYPPPYTRYEVFTPYTRYPYRTVGKLFFKRGSSSFVCSAASIGGDAIWTAGHCLHSGNNKASGWSKNVIFVPAYKDGAAPFGQWQVKQQWVRNAWYKNGISKGLCQDMGGAIVYKRNNRRLSQVVGWLGFAWNHSKYQHWTQLGYPAAAPFNGKRLIKSTSSYAYNGSVPCTPKPNGVGSDLTGGSSGGPWILKFGTNNWLNGLNSYRRGNKPQEMFSPHFNNNAKSLYDVVTKAKA